MILDVENHVIQNLGVKDFNGKVFYKTFFQGFLIKDLNKKFKNKQKTIKILEKKLQELKKLP